MLIRSHGNMGLPAIFGNSRPFWHMVFVGAVGVPTFLTTYYYHQLLTQIGLLLVIPIGFFIAGQIALLLWLSKHPNPMLRAAGQAAGTVFQYLALFQGLILTVLVFYVLGGGATSGGAGGGRGAFAADFVIGATWLSMFIYGATGVPLAFFTTRLAGKIAGGLYLFTALAPPFWLVLFEEDTIRAYAAANAGSLLLMALAYYMAMSVIGMWLMVGPLSDANAGGAD